MTVKTRAKHILIELKGHAPFTFIGATLGIVFMLVFRNVSETGSHTLFAIFHPAHVTLSAMVTASMFKIHAMKKHFALVLIVGLLGSIGIATLSDIIIPHTGLEMLELEAPADSQPESDIHFSFIEEWYIIIPAAFLGVFIAFFLPRTKFPHTAHVLISTWASSSYLLMNVNFDITIAIAMGIFATLFVAIWIPCCISDIVFPLLFVNSDLELTEPCKDHSPHSHLHLRKDTDESENFPDTAS